MKLFKETIGIRNRVERPIGEIPLEGKCDALKKRAKELADEILKYKGVIGITLGGGLSRGYGDDFSEIDLNIYLEDDVYHEWIIGKGPIPHGDALWEESWVDIAFYSYKNELNENWNLVRKWDASYNIILFDPEDKIKILFNDKDVFSSPEKYDLAFKCFQECEYLGDLVVRQWIERLDPLSANQLLNFGISGLIGMIFLANDEYPPHPKWALNYSYSLKWLPRDWKERISKVILTKEVSLNEAKRRLRLFIQLYEDCKEKIYGKEFRNLGYITISTMEEMQFIIDNSPIQIEKFAESFDLKHLSYEPLFEFTEMVTKKNNKLITFNKEKYIKHKNMNFPTVLNWSKSLLHNLNIN
jgi:hypothetical protein